MSILIKNGRVANASEEFQADIFIEGEHIVAIGANLPYKAEKVIDATGKVVVPGGIDPHVHLDMPFMGTFSSDDYETGTRAALFGGTTMVIDFILQTQGDSLYNALRVWQQKSVVPTCKNAKMNVLSPEQCTTNEAAAHRECRYAPLSCCDDC